MNEFFRITRPAITTNNKTEMKIIHVNVNGIAKKKYKIIQLLDLEKPDILAVSETHLKDKQEFVVRGYEWTGSNFEAAVRGSRGVGFLIRKGIKYSIIRHE